MSTTATKTADRNQLSVLATLASLLERLDRSQAPVDAGQYRLVARRLSDQLSAIPIDDAVRAVLAASPAAADVYENLEYQHAGLCLQPLERSLSAEMQARGAIDSARV